MRRLLPTEAAPRRETSSVTAVKATDEWVTTTHRAKLAYVYVRQSSLNQVMHQESTELRYRLVDRAVALGGRPHLSTGLFLPPAPSPPRPLDLAGMAALPGAAGSYSLFPARGPVGDSGQGAPLTSGLLWPFGHG